MRRSREDTARTRRRAVAAASRLFRERGIESVSLGDVMAKLKMTAGGFYRHFESKEALAAEACAAAFASSGLAGEPARSAEARYLGRVCSGARRLTPARVGRRGCPRRWYARADRGKDRDHRDIHDRPPRFRGVPDAFGSPTPPAAGIKLSCISCGRRSRSSGRSTSHRAGSSLRRQPSAAMRRRVSGKTFGPPQGMPRNSSGSQCERPTSTYPPSSAGPITTSSPPARARSASRRYCAESAGISLPIRIARAACSGASAGKAKARERNGSRRSLGTDHPSRTPGSAPPALRWAAR